MDGAAAEPANLQGHLERLSSRFDRFEARSNASDLQLMRINEQVESLSRLVVSLHDTMRARPANIRQKSRAGVVRRPLDSPTAAAGAANAALIDGSQRELQGMSC